MVGAGQDGAEAAKPETLADLGEWELIRRLGAFAPPGQFGDDAALLDLPGVGAAKPVLAGRPGGAAPDGAGGPESAEAGAAARSPALVVNTDVLVEDIHFSDATTAAADVGWRAAAANLSDLAAMGCTEVVGLTVGLVAPASTPWSWVEGVYGGLREALETYGGVLLGGDCSGGGQRMLAITAIGRLAAPRRPVEALLAAETSATAGLIQPMQATSCGEGPDPEAIRPMQAAGSAEREGLQLLEPTSRGAREGIEPMQAARRDEGEAIAEIQPVEANKPGEQRPPALAPAPGSPPRQRPAPPAPAAPDSGPIRRSGGRPGDRLVCTGPHGLSRLGLALLQGEIGAGTLDPELSQRAIGAHRRPQPRFDAVRALIASRPAAAPWRVGGCDSSDGLAAAAAAIAASSDCAAQLERASLPLDAAMASLPEAEAWCLGGGEDFELVLALAPAWAEALIAALPGATLIGELVAGEAGALGWTSGEAWNQGEGRDAGSSGYSHFS